VNIYDAMAIVFGDCPACEAKAGEECMNRSGRRSGGTHWQRKAAVQEWRKADHQKLYQQFRLSAIEWLGRKEQPEYGLSGC
jgi:hypothetical protein